MALYHYKAVDKNGLIKKGTIEVGNVQEIEHRINAINLELISFKEKSPLFQFGSISNKVSRQELITFVFHLEQLTKAGIPIITGLRDLRDTMEHSALRTVLGSIIDRIEGGKTLSEALAEYPEIFDHIFVTLIQIGESTGKLDRILHDLANSLKWIDELVSHTRKIMIYPAVVSLVVIAVIAFLMIYLVPQLIPFIEEMGGELPVHTLALIAVSNFLIEYWYLVFSIPPVMVFVIRYLYKNNEAFAYQIDALSLKLWIIGPILFKLKLARFSNYLSLMYSSGLTILHALEISEGLLGNRVLEEALQRVHMQLHDGTSIADSFTNVGIFPQFVIRMLQVGEMSGSLDNSLNNITYFYNREVTEAIDELEPALQPILTVVMGGMVAWIMLSVLGPVYDTIAKANF